MVWLMLAMMPFCSSSRITVDALTLSRSENSLTVSVGGTSTGPLGNTVATAAAPLADASAGRARFCGLRRGPGLRGPRYCMRAPFLKRNVGWDEDHPTAHGRRFLECGRRYRCGLARVSFCGTFEIGAIRGGDLGFQRVGQGAAQSPAPAIEAGA